MLPRHPKSRVSHVRHDLNLSVHKARLVLIDNSWPDDRIGSAVGDQHRLANAGQKIIVVEGAREERLDGHTAERTGYTPTSGKDLRSRVARSTGAITTRGCGTLSSTSVAKKTRNEAEKFLREDRRGLVMPSFVMPPIRLIPLMSPSP